MQIAITVEGQRGLTWQRWQRFALAVESLGFAGLYRSDHFTDADPPDQDSLEIWASLTWLASHTQRIEFGPLVTPLSFRHPVHTARMAKDVDDLSGGRLVLGLGAGWGGGAREHRTFGFELLRVPERFARFEEGLRVIQGLLQSDHPVSLDGQYFCLEQARLLPRPQRKGGPPILIGGNGPQRVLPLAAKYADDWNAIYRTPTQFKELNTQLDHLLDEIERPRNSVRRSQMQGILFAADQAKLQTKINGTTPGELQNRGLLVGTPNQIIDQLGQLEIVGVEQVMLQWPDLDDLSGLETFSTTVFSQISQKKMKEVL